MLKLISLLFMILLIISCGGEVGTVYHNYSVNNIKNDNTTLDKPDGNNLITKVPNCIPGTECNKKQSPINNPSSPCLPGVDCSNLDINEDKIDSIEDNTSNNGNSNSDINESSKYCLPGVRRC